MTQVVEAASPATEGESVEKLQGVSPAELEEVFRRYAGELYGLAYSLMGNPADAEDVLQQSLLGALKSLAAFQGRSSLRTWLYTIVMNQASKARRSMKLRKAASLEAGELTDNATRGSAKGTAFSRGSSSASVERKLDVATMLEALSFEHREVVVLREMRHLSYDEIAQVLGIPRGTVESRLFRARRFLREKFSSYLD